MDRPITQPCSNAVINPPPSGNLPTRRNSPTHSQHSSNVALSSPPPNADPTRIEAEVCLIVNEGGSPPSRIATSQNTPSTHSPLTVINQPPPSGNPTRIVAEVQSRWRTVWLALKTLGVVFGSLVTSPLYVYPSMPLKSPTEGDYLGVFSIMFWTLTLIGVVKYACIAVRADDHGEGGTFALYSLLCRHMKIDLLSRRNVLQEEGGLENQSSRINKFFERSLVAKRVLLFMAMLGMCMLIGDGVLTPAISVLSAIGGVRTPFPSVSKAWVKALSVVIIIGLFLLQRFGTSKVSFLFSPIMGMWTLVTPLVGIYSVAMNYPTIFKAISPHYIVRFFLQNGTKGWSLLGGTILCITGSEAMYADLGHFDRPSIQMAFLFTVYPSLVVTYAGQTAYLIRHPYDLEDGFYKFIPSKIYWPVFVLATLAAIVASQSLISATFSVIKQSVALDYFPRVKVVHTSLTHEGEVYAPEVNYVAMILCVSVVLIFGDGKEIGNAYGLVVSIVMLITTALLTLVMIVIWRTPTILVALYLLVFFSFEGIYVSAVFTKLMDGGWIPFAISLILAFIMFGWYHGRQKKLEYELSHNIDVEQLQTLLLEFGVRRVPGFCFFYTNIEEGLPPILGHYVKNMRSLHNVTVLTTLRYSLVANVSSEERVVFRKMAGIDGVYRCVIHHGYADALDLEIGSLVWHALIKSDSTEEVAQLEAARQAGVVHVRGRTTFYMGKNSSWFDRIILGFYELMHRSCRPALPPTLAIPLTQRVEIGMMYEA